MSGGDTIDWEGLKTKLARLHGAQGQGSGAGLARERAVLRMRAERLARRGRDKAAEAKRLPVLAFRIKGEVYAVELLHLVEAATAIRCTPLPGAPPELVGVTNLRGEIRPVLDAAGILNAGGAAPAAAEAPPNGAIMAVFLRRQGAEVGLKVDAIDKVRLIREDELSAAATTSVFVKGVTPDMLIVLDASAILALPMVRGGDGAGAAEES